MCGINGIFAYHYAANPVDRAEVLRTRDHMLKRGPDGAGVWHSTDGRIGLGHRRLAIIDLSDAGAQPMASTDGRLVVTFNGEIYNFGIAVLEAMACGVPVIVTPGVGLAPAIAAAGAGLVVDGDPRSVGEAIAHLLRDDDARKRMGAAGRKAAIEQFSWEAIAKSMTAVYTAAKSGGSHS
jgi:glycogen synthase